MVTAETAVAVPAVLLVLTLGLGASTVAVDAVRCVDAARAGARAAARGDDGAARARELAPPGSAVAVSRGGGRVTVDVAAPGRPATAWLAIRPSARSVADVESDGPR